MLASIAIENFRCVQSAVLELDPCATGISGANASGKTTLLEAIFFLAHSRSFRSATRAELITAGAPGFQIVASLTTPTGKSTAGTAFDGSELTLRLRGEETPAWQLAKALPVQVIDQSVHRVIEEGSLRRRRLCDWGVFHVKPTFLDAWRRYQRVLAQRNVLLRTGAPDAAIAVWSEALIAAAPAVHIHRQDYLTLLGPLFESLAAELIDQPVTLSYRQGWPNDLSFAEALVKSKARERRARTTNVGPHRADVQIQIDDVPAKQRVSRGQQKLLASALILAQIELLARVDPLPVCLLLDDPAAELDVDNLGKLLNVVKRTPAQLVITSLHNRRFETLPMGRVFHVEQGRIRQIQ